MMKTILTLLLAGMAGLCSVDTFAQSHITPGRLDTRFPGFVRTFDDTSLFRNAMTEMRVGYQWGHADYMRMNQCFKTSFTNNNWSYYNQGLDTIALATKTAWTKKSLRTFDRTRANYLGWGLGSWFYDTLGQGLAFTRGWYGYRWEPAENGEAGKHWQPRLPRTPTQEGSWPYGFAMRHDSTRRVANPADPNHKWLLVDSTKFTTGWTKILDSCEPRTELYRTSNIQYRGGEVVTGDSVNGNRMILAITVRRLHDTSRAGGNDPVLRMRVVGKRFRQKIAGDEQPVLFNFTKTPLMDTSSANILTAGRGKLLGVQTLAAGIYDTVITITRNQLPSGTDRDITIYAEFRTDEIFRSNGFDWLPTGTFLKNTTNPYLPFFADTNVQRTTIDTMTPVIEYYPNASVAIRQVTIITPYGFRALCGVYDSLYANLFRREVQKIADHQLFWKDTLFGAGNSAKLYVSNFYTVDEFTPAEELGVYYRSGLINHMLTSETEYDGYRYRDQVYETGDAEKRMHLLPWKWFWCSGLQTVRPSTASPMLHDATWASMDGNTQNVNPGQPFPTMYLKHGYGWTNAAYERPYSTAYETYGSSRMPADTLYIPYGLPLADSIKDERAFMTMVGMDSDVGLQPIWQRTLYTKFATTGDWYFRKTSQPWMCELFYHHRLKFKKNSVGRSFIWFTTWRPQHGNEGRLEIGTALAFGAKGFLIDRLNDQAKGTYPTPGMVANGGTETREPGSVMDMVTTHLDVITTHDSSNIYRHPELGGDFLPPNDPWNLNQFMNFDSVAQSSGVGRIRPGTDSLNLYLGQLTNRTVIKEAVDLFMHPDWTTHFWNMKPVAWRGYGYFDMKQDPYGALNRWLDTTQGLQLKYKTKANPASSAYTYVNEPANERLADIVILDESPGAAVSTDSCIIAVINRRTAPFTLTNDYANYPDSIRCYTSVEYDSICRAFEAANPTLPTIRYDQVGSRQITIPLDYKDPMGRPMNLMVQEMSLDTLHRLDTLLGNKTSLVVNFAPGQTRFFRVIPVPAEETATNGFLDHSNQRKLVAFPKITGMTSVTDPVDSRTYLRMVLGDTMWYHQVYHKRRTENPASALSVFYRRSKPLRTTRDTGGTTANLFDASTIEWETEQLVSDKVLYAANPPNPATVHDLSCGYPSLVVRADTNGGLVTSKVYVVFGCDYPVPNNRQVLVCESVIPAEWSTLAQQNYYAVNKSYVLAVTPTNAPYGIRHMGTPMVNASQNGNYYCWASWTGIGVGFKPPHMREFVAGQTSTIRANWYSAGFHPSMNSYSRLNIGEDDAGLVWVEGLAPEAGVGIYYTRLFYDAAHGLWNGLSPGPLRDVVGPPLLFAGNPAIAAIAYDSLTFDGYNYAAIYSYPVIYRHLSDWATDVPNTRHVLRLVNHKAERIFWQVQHREPGTGAYAETMLGRRVVDISDYTRRPPYAFAHDYLYSTAEHYLYHPTQHLKGPDVVQGEQWGEPYSLPANTAPGFEDSCAVLSFWSEAAPADPAPRPWHMAYGFGYYGSVVDHHRDSLIAAGLLKGLSAVGRYPHQAARFSVSAHRGWQRNRRIYNRPGGDWNLYNPPTPTIASSSQYFYKESQQDMEAVLCHGFRRRYADAAIVPTSATLAPIVVHATGETLMLRPDLPLDADDESKALPKRYASAWKAMPGISDVSFESHVRGEESVALLFVERRSDGRRQAMDVMTAGREAMAMTETYTVLGDAEEQYRFVIEARTEMDYGVQDVRLVERRDRDSDRLPKSRYGGVLDLRTMSVAAASETMAVYPNPASESLSIAFHSTHSAHTAMLSIYNSCGVEIVTVACRGTDAVHLDTGTWSSGMYTAVLRADIPGVPPRTAPITIVR